MFWFEPPSQLVNWEYHAEKVLDDEHIQFIENYVLDNESQIQRAEILTQAGAPVTEYRRCDIFFFSDYEHTSPLYRKVYDAISEINSHHFRFALSYAEPFQYSMYKAEDLGFYDLHCDSYLRNTSGFIRKISFTILLNDPSEFEGGELLFHTEREPRKATMQKGDMILFPSFIPHSVTPVTKGVRKTLVGWICGPNFS
jgi:PKHD-type hydroxylase